MFIHYTTYKKTILWAQLYTYSDIDVKPCYFGAKKISIK